MKLKKNIKYLVIFFIILLIVIIIYRIIKSLRIENYENENNIIIPDIIGGLGNQLFLVASAFAFSKDNNYKLMLDNRKDVSSYGKPRPTYNNTVFYKIPVTDIDTSKFKKLNETDFANGYNKVKNENIFLTGGYYQEAKYFDKYRKELLELLEPNEETKNKINQIIKNNNINLETDNLIATHIRLDDIYTPIDADKRVYDEDEYETIRKNIPEFFKSNSNTKFIIFSNDVPRTKDIFKNISGNIDTSKLIYISSDDYVELGLMAMCNEYIASPSTFNWWGIYLNRNLDNVKNKIHIYWKQDTDYRKDFYKKYEYLIDSNRNQNGNIMTCVSGFWNVNNKHGNKFNDWFKNTLAINCPYVFFTDEENFEKIKTFRKNYPTHFIKKDISDFKTFKMNIENNTHKIHVPSKELGLIWLEKMNLMLETLEINPYNSEWFCWIDAGICVFRDKEPPTSLFPNPDKMNLLKKDKINYSTSDNISKEELEKIKNWEYVHDFSAGAFIIHKSIIKNIVNKFYQYLDKCLKENKSFSCYSEQVIISRILIENPNLFNKIANGYGNIITELL
jgi:hypothetical protein